MPWQMCQMMLINTSPLTGLGHIHPVCAYVKTGTLDAPDSVTLVSDLQFNLECALTHTLYITLAISTSINSNDHTGLIVPYLGEGYYTQVCEKRSKGRVS